MRNGDISNQQEARLLLVFEGLIATLPSAKARGKYDMLARVGQWKRAVRQFKINEPAARIIWDTAFRRGYSLDAVTFLDEDALEHVEEFIAAENLPIGHVTYSDKYLLARSLNYRPDVVGVFHANPADVLVYGSKGYLVNPDHPVLIGA